jgi:hypothetical protein
MKQEEKFKTGIEPAKVLSKNQEPNNTGIQPYLQGRTHHSHQLKPGNGQ